MTRGEEAQVTARRLRDPARPTAGVGVARRIQAAPELDQHVVRVGVDRYVAARAGLPEVSELAGYPRHHAEDLRYEAAAIHRRSERRRLRTVAAAPAVGRMVAVDLVGAGDHRVQAVAGAPAPAVIRGQSIRP